MNPSPVRVLLVDDDEDYFILTRDLLRDAGPGFEVRWASTAEEGLRCVLASDCDVALVDYTLGDATGADVIARAHAAGSRIPMIVLTGRTDEEADHDAMHAGASDYLYKGNLDGRMLERSIRYARERHDAAEALVEANCRLEERVAERTTELASALERVRRSAELQKRFVESASHDLRTPLTVLKAEIEMLDAPRVSADDRRVSIARMREQLRTLESLAADLAMLTTVESLDAGDGRRRVGLDALMLECIAELSVAAEHRGLHWELNIDGAIDVLADVGAVRRAILVVLDNAVRYSRVGGTIHIWLGRDESSKMAQLDVRDDGPGIAPEDLPNIFERFYRGDRSRASGGSGLGLPIARAVVESHGGSIKVSSAPPLGSTFSISMPALTDAVEPPPIPDTR
jgi:signal transduction histidine kinase